MTQVVSTGTQTLGSFLPVLWKLPSTEYLEDLSEEFMIFEQGNIERDVVNQDPDSQIIISSYYKPVKVKKLTQYKSGQKGVKCEIAVESVIKLNTTRKQTKNKGSLCSSRTSQDSQPETSLGTRREVSTHIGSTLDENNDGNHTRMEEDYSNENEKEGDSINKTEIKDTYRKVSSGGTVLSSGTMSLNETVLLGTNKNVAETKESGDHKTGGIDYLGGNNKNTSVMPAEGHYDEVDISGRFKNHTMVMMLHNYCKKSVAKTEKINVNNATAYYDDRKKPEGLKHTKTYKYQKGYRKVEIAGCLNLSYAIKDGFILASRRNSQGQNSELTMAENSDIIDKGEPQKDDMSTQLLKNNIPDGTENGDEQGVSGFVNEGNYEGVCKGDNNDTANLTRGDNLDNNKPIISDTQTQESHTSEHEHPSKCKFCNKWFKDRSYFYVHKWSHIAKSQNLRFKCSICSREFKTIPRMNSHFKVSHSDIKPYLCKFCGKSFSHKGSFDCHTNTHTKDIKYSCKYCNQNFTEKSKLNNHLKKCPLGEETSDQSQTIKCNCCNKSFVNENNLQKHKNSMNKQMNEHHVCPKCGKEFKTLGRVNAHVRVVHPKVKAFQCYKCGKCFATNHILNAHLRNHLNSISKPYLCSFCPKRFAQSHSCKQHETIHKKSDSSFGTYQEKKLCTICHKWIVKSFFNQHLLKHMGLQLKTHVCTICNKQFANKHNLMVHNRIHSRVKPFSCEHCNMSFITKSSLVRHLRWHAGFKRESKFPCEICGKTFTYNYKRKRHQAKHAEYAAFECVYCRVKFHTHDDLHTHLISSEQCSSDLYTNVTMATNCSNVQVKIVGKECQVTKVTDSTN